MSRPSILIVAVARGEHYRHLRTILGSGSAGGAPLLLGDDHFRTRWTQPQTSMNTWWQQALSLQGLPQNAPPLKLVKAFQDPSRALSQAMRRFTMIMAQEPAAPPPPGLWSATLLAFQRLGVPVVQLVNAPIYEESEISAIFSGGELRVRSVNQRWRDELLEVLIATSRAELFVASSDGMLPWPVPTPLPESPPDLCEQLLANQLTSLGDDTTAVRCSDAPQQTEWAAAVVHKLIVKEQQPPEEILICCPPNQKVMLAYALSDLTVPHTVSAPLGRSVAGNRLARWFISEPTLQDLLDVATLNPDAHRYWKRRCSAELISDLALTEVPHRENDLQRDTLQHLDHSWPSKAGLTVELQQLISQSIHRLPETRCRNLLLSSLKALFESPAPTTFLVSLLNRHVLHSDPKGVLIIDGDSPFWPYRTHLLWLDAKSSRTNGAIRFRQHERVWVSHSSNAGQWAELFEPHCLPPKQPHLMRQVRRRTADARYRQWVKNPGTVGLVHQIIGQRGQGTGPFHGDIGHGPKTNSYVTVTDAESYLHCPMRMWFEKRLRLTPLRQDSPSLVASERGSALHRIVERFVDAFDQPAFEVPTAQAQEVLAKIARETITELEEEGKADPTFLAYASKQWGAGLLEDSAKGLLASWLEEEQNRQPKTEVVATELKTRPVEVGPFQLVGILDRLDRIDQIMVVTDYKTGAPPTSTDIMEGRALQPVVYGEAVAQQYPGFSVAASYLSMQRPDRVSWTSWVGEPEALAELAPGQPAVELTAEERADLLIAAGERLKPLAMGRYAPSSEKPQKVGCARCPWRRACRRLPR